MRLWSLHPCYLDAKGLIACWREGLLARKVLQGETSGYRQHPQLERFRRASDPLAAIETYLDGILEEALKRGYRFDTSKITPRQSIPRINVTQGQLCYERDHLRKKLAIRDVRALDRLDREEIPSAHPLFRTVTGSTEPWERLAPGRDRKG